MKQEILAYLRNNAPTVYKRAYLAGMFGISVRELRAITAELVSENQPILSSDDGLFYSTDPDQIKRVAMRYISMGEQTKHRGLALQETAEKYRHEKMEQLELPA